MSEGNLQSQAKMRTDVEVWGHLGPQERGRCGTGPGGKKTLAAQPPTGQC